MFSINDHVLVELLSPGEMQKLKGPQSALLINDLDSEILVGRVIDGGNQKEMETALAAGDLVFFAAKATFPVKVQGKPINIVKQSSILLVLSEMEV